MTAVGRIRVPRQVWVGFALLALTLCGVLLFHALADADRALLAPSGPEETVLRSVRLAGFEQAATGSDDATAVLRMDIPALSSVPDVEIAWQTGFATLAAAYPGAERYVLHIRAGDVGLLELEAPADVVRAAVEADDAGALRAGFVARSMAGSEEPSYVGTHLPADALTIGAQLDGEYLDAKNRAAGLLGESGPLAVPTASLADAALAARREAPGVPAPGPDERAVDLYLERLGNALGELELAGAPALLDEVRSLGASPGRDAIARIRSHVLAIEALAVPESGASMLAGVHRLTEEVASAPLTPGAPSDAVLAAAGAADAPATATDVRQFERVSTLDIRPSQGAPGDALPEQVLRLHARGGVPPAIAWSTPGGVVSVAPEVWQAYLRADGALYWLAGDSGEVALTDGSIRGWAFSQNRAALVDASRTGTVHTYFPAE